VNLICHKCGKRSPEHKFQVTRKTSKCPQCGHVIEYYDATNPPNIPDELRSEIVDRFMVEATPGECLFQFFWSHRFEYGYKEQGELFNAEVCHPKGETDL